MECAALDCEKCIDGVCTEIDIEIDEKHQCIKYLPSREILLEMLRVANAKIHALETNKDTPIRQPLSQRIERPARNTLSANGMTVVDNTTEKRAV